MGENKSESFTLAPSCDNKPTEAIRNQTMALEILLKEAYSNHKETIRLCREEQKDKFNKMVALKNKMFERGKEIKKECNILKKENQDLKQALSSRTDVPCKNCDHLRRSLDSLEEAYKRSLSEKEKMIQYLESQLNGQHHSFNSDQNNASPKTSPENQKNNRLRLKASQKRVVYKGSPEENAVQNPPRRIGTNSKPSTNAPLLNIPETCLPDTCVADLIADKKPVESDELTIIPDTLALFNPWDSDMDQDLSDSPEEVVEKSLALESPYNEPNSPSDADLLMVASAKPSESVTITNEPDSVTKPSDKEIRDQSNNYQADSLLPERSVKMDDCDNIVKPFKAILSDLGNSFKSPTKSPLRKKRRQSSNESSSQTKKDEKTEKNTERNDEVVLLPQCVPNGQNVKSLSFEGKKFGRRSRSRENKSKHYEFDADQTLPPENWGNETLSDSEVSHRGNIADGSDDLIWNTACPPVSVPVRNSPRKTDEQMTQMNGSLAASMQMTQFLEENEVATEPRNGQSKKSRGKSDIVEVESCSQTFPSRSYKFGAVTKSPALIAVEDVVAAKPGKKNAEKTFSDSFDQVPKKEEISYAYHTVVRKKAERRKLNGYTCRECAEYYKAKGLTEEEIRIQVGDCSRHRALYEAPQTPEHFWSVGFPDTMECENRGYFVEDDPKTPVPRQLRRRRRFQQSKKTVDDKEDKKQTKEADEEIGMTQMLEYLSAESGDED